MASDNEAFCVSDPNFAVICSFLDCFGKSCGIDYPDIATLQTMLEDTHEVPQPLVDLHIKLLRKTRKSVSSEKWERALVKFCHTYSNQDGWELERFGYKKARIGVKLRLLKVLLESQFDLNQKFKNEVNKLAANELRVQPLGRDKTGLAYWFQLDEGCNIRVYREDLDEESWELVANDREGVVKLISTLSDGEIGSVPINEDSNSLEISEKPIIDTGQVSTSPPSVNDDVNGSGAQENGVSSDSKNQNQLNNKVPNKENIQKMANTKINNKITNEIDNSDEGSGEEDDEEDEEDEEEEEDDDEEEVSNEEDEDEERVSKQNTEEEEEDEEEEEEENEKGSQCSEVDDETTQVKATPVAAIVSQAPIPQLKKSVKDDEYTKRKTVVTYESENFEKETVKMSVIKPTIIESAPLKSIGTPVITTSPLKLVNISELKHTTNERISDMTMATSVSIIKSTPNEEPINSTIKMHEKLPPKNLLPFMDPILNHTKFPIKPIDKLAANLVRMQSEKLEKPSASKLLEKIAENLARSSGAHGSSVINGDDDKFSSEFSARNQPEKINLIGHVRNSRGIDLSTSPRGWESANDHNRPMDFSGIDLSSRKTTTKSTDLPSPGYRPQEFQYREMDLSTRKISKSELPNLPYDSRASMLRNHAMVTDLSKRQIPFVNYEMPSVAPAAYHSGSRKPGKEEHRLANYTILPDPSKLASMRSGGVKRPLECIEDPSPEMLKRLRADLMPIRGAIDKKSSLAATMRRNDVGPAIEEPLMMVHGEGSGSDCDAGNHEVGDAIEEPVIFFYGEGNGHDCDTGNPSDGTSTDSKDNKESKDEECNEISATLSQTKVTDDNNQNSENNAQMETSNTTGAIVKSVQMNSDNIEDNPTTTITSNCQQLDDAATSDTTKAKFKPSLGVQVIPKTSSGAPIKRFSRWDVGGPEEKRECDSSIISNDESISLESNINDTARHSEEDTTNLTVNSSSTKCKLDTDDITSTTNQNLLDNIATSSQLSEDNKVSTDSEFQCDSSSIEPINVESTVQEKRSECTEEMKAEAAPYDETDDAPKFFFGPNCVSYTPTTVGKVNIEADAASSSTNPPIKLEAAENTSTTDNNNVTGNVDVPVAVSEPILAEADDGNSEKTICDDDEAIESSDLSSIKSTDVPIDEEPSVSDDNKEVTSDSNLRKVEEQNTEMNISENVKLDEDQPTTTVNHEVPESSTSSSTDLGDKQSEENDHPQILSRPENISFDDTVTNSECEKVEKSNTKTPDVISVVESTSLTNEVCSTSAIDDSIEDNSSETIVKTVDSSNVEKDLEIEAVESNSNIDHGNNNANSELEEVTSESIVDEVTRQVEEIAVDSIQDEQEPKVESSIVDTPLQIKIELNPKTEENVDDKNQSCDTSVLESVNDIISDQESSAESISLSVADSSVSKVVETVETPSSEKYDQDDSQKVVDSTDTFGDDFSDKQSDSTNPDSNKPNVIVDKSSDTSELTKNSIAQPTEKPEELQTEIPDSNTFELNKTTEKPSAKDESLDSSSVIHSADNVSEENLTNSEKSHTGVSDIIIEQKEEKLSEISNENISLPNNKEVESNVSTIDKESDKSSDSSSVKVSTLDSTKSESINQTLLVANYDSNESNDACSDDVFVADDKMEIDSHKVKESMVIESENTNQLSLEFSEKIKIDESKTDTKQISTEINTEIMNQTPSSKDESELDNNTADENKKVLDISAAETVADTTVEQEPIIDSIESSTKCPIEEIEEESIAKPEESLKDLSIKKDMSVISIESVKDSAIEEKISTENSVESVECLPLRAEIFEKSISSIRNSPIQDDTIIKPTASVEEVLIDEKSIEKPAEFVEESQTQVESVTKSPESVKDSLMKQETFKKSMKNLSVEEESNSQSTQSSKDSTSEKESIEGFVESVKDTLAQEQSMEKPIESIINLTIEKKSVECVKDSSLEESHIAEINQKLCDADKIKIIPELINQDSVTANEQPVTEIIEEKSLVTTKELNKDKVSESIKITPESKIFPESNPGKMSNVEEVKRENLENSSEKVTDDVPTFGSVYSGSNSPIYSDEDFEDDEPPMLQVSKQVRTEIDELNQNVLDKSTCINELSKDKQLLNKTQYQTEYTVSPSIIAPMTKNDQYITKLQIGVKPEIDILDNASNAPFINENTPTKIEKSVCENLPSISMKESLEEFKPNLTVSIVPNVVNATLDDNKTESLIYLKSDVKKEASKRVHHVIDTEDLPPFKSKPIDIDYVKDKPQTLANDIKFTPDIKPIDIDDKTLDPSTEIITALTLPVLQSEKKVAEAINEGISQISANNLSDAKQSINLQDQDTIVITDLSNAKPIVDNNDSDDSMGVDNECLFESTENDVDPLLIVNDGLTGEKMDLENSEEKLGVRVKSVNEIQYEGWKLDSTETMTQPTKISRKRRNSAHESNSEDGTTKQDDELEDMTSSKRMKLRGKRTPDMTLRKSVEKNRFEGGSSEDEAPTTVESIPSTLPNPPLTEEIKNEITEPITADPFKPKSKAKGRRRRGFRSKRRASRHKKSDTTSSVAEVPILATDDTANENVSESTPTARKKRKKRKMVLGLEIGIDIALPDSQVNSGTGLDETPVRQSRRIAQIKIKEEADRRRIEEEALGEMKEKKERDIADKKKRKKGKTECDDYPPIKLDIREEKEVKIKKKRKKRRKEAKFNEAKPWQSSSGSSTEDEDQNDEDLDDEDDIESEESLLFRSDHEFSPESDLEKDAETEPMRRARTAQKLQNDVEEAEDEYACQKCGKADHPEWILLCDTCDKGWHCSCLRPALMLIPEGDWFCPPCQHNVLVNKLRDSLKTYDQLAKRHENEILRKKRLAFVGISLDNVLQKNDANRQRRPSRMSSRDDDESDEDNDDDDDDDAASHGGSSSSSESSDSGSSETGSSSDESEPVYQLRERRCANTYKFNEYDDMINAAIQDEVEAVQGAGNQGRGKDISTIVNAEKEDAQVEPFEKQMEDEDDEDKQSDKDSEKELSKDGDYTDDENQHKSLSNKKLLSRKKHRKLNSLDISSEDDPESDEDFKGSSSDEEEDYEDQLLSSDDSSFTESRRRGKKNSRPVRRSTRAARKTRYDEDFINDDSDESDRPKRKKSKSTWDESETEESDNSWRSRKKRSKPSSAPRFRTSVKSKSKKKKKRKRIIEPDNQSDNDEEEEIIATTAAINVEEEEEKKMEATEVPQQIEPIEDPIVKEPISIVEPSVPIPELSQEPPSEDDDNNKLILSVDSKEEEDHEIPPILEPKSEYPTHYPPRAPVIVEENMEKKEERTPKQKKTPTIRRKIIYGGLPDDRPPQDEEPLGRRTRGRKINYQVDAMMSDSEEELKKALRKTEESEDEFVVHEKDDFVHEDVDKDSDSGDIYSPNKDTPRGRYKSPKNRRMKKSPGGKSMTDNGEPKQRKKPGPKPGSKNKPRQPKTIIPSLEGGVIGDVAEGSLASLGTGELAELDEEQLEQMMMEDEEYGRRQLELAAIEIAKNKKKEEREAKKLEKARLKALEILAAEQQRDPNAPEGPDGEAPKKKKRGRRSKAEILADQMRRDGAPHLVGGLTSPPQNIPTIVSPSITIVNPALSTMPVIMMPGDNADRPTPEGQMPMISGPEGHLFNPDGTPMKPKRRGRGKGKKTLAMEAARAAETAAKAAAEARGLGLTGADVNSELNHDDIPNVLPTPGSSTSGSAPSTPPAIAVSSQGLPSSNPQSVYPQLPPSQQSSVITRMLQAQPVSTPPQSFTAAAAAMGQKYFGVPNAASQMMGGPRPAYDMSSRGRIPSPYNSRQPGQPPPMPPHFAAVRSGTPPMRMRVPGPTQLYHTPHHPMDPSPSGGGPISINSRDRASPLGPSPAMIPPAAGSPLAKGGPTPPPYVRGGPALSRFSDNPQLGARHQLPPFTSASPANHGMQQPSPPPNRPPGNFSPYHPQPPPNYHYGAYPAPAPMPTADDAAAYQGSPYSAEHFSTSAENPPSIQPPTPQSSQSQPPPPTSQQHPPPHSNETAVHGPGKQYDEEGSGEFGGLVSYFSSQREDDLDS